MKVFSVYLLLLYYLHSYSFAWMVKNIPISHFPQCSELCRNNENCSSWVIGRNPDRSLSCFLESPVIEKIKTQFSTAFNRNDTAASGTKLDAPWKKVIKLDSVLRGPAVLDSSSVINIERHFVRGCSYTISMWVWMWRKRHMPPSFDFISLFNTRPTSPKTTNLDPLFPSVLFNVGPGHVSDRYFFSVTKDSRGFAQGVWGLRADEGRVGFHRWTHIALTINETTLAGYVDGVFVEYLNLFPRDPKYPMCPYFNWTRNYAAQKGANSSQEGVKLDISNTIFQIGGNRNANTMIGIVQDVMIISNAALSNDQIHSLMKDRPAVPLPTLTKLMNEYDIYSLENYCVLPWQQNFYLMWAWGLCPDTVCGHICLSEGFLLGLNSYFATVISSDRTATSNQLRNISGVSRMLLSMIGGEQISELLSGHNIDEPDTLDLPQVSMDLFGITLPELEATLDAYYDDDYQDESSDIFSDAEPDGNQQDERGIGPSVEAPAMKYPKRRNEDPYDDYHDYGDDNNQDSNSLRSRLFGQANKMNAHNDLDMYASYYEDIEQYGYDDGYGDSYDEAYADAYYQDHGFELAQANKVQGLTFEQLRRKHLISTGEVSHKKASSKSSSRANPIEVDSLTREEGSQPGLSTPDLSIDKAKPNNTSNITNSLEPNSPGNGDERASNRHLPTRIVSQSTTPSAKLRAPKSKTSNGTVTKPSSDTTNVTVWGNATIGAVRKTIVTVASNVFKSISTMLTSTNQDIVLKLNLTAPGNYSRAEKLLMELVRKSRFNSLELFEDSRIVQAQELYDGAITWLSGRDEHMQSKEVLQQTLAEWRSELNEKVFSALALAIFLADDGTTEADLDVEWSFKYPSIVAHPARSVLAFRSGFDMKTYMSLTGFGESPTVMKALGGAKLVDLISPLSNGSLFTQEGNAITSGDQAIHKVTAVAFVSVNGESSTPGEFIKSTINETSWLRLISELSDEEFVSFVDNSTSTIDKAVGNSNLSHHFDLLSRLGLDMTYIQSISTHLLTTTVEKVLPMLLAEQPKPFSENECISAAASYFPLSQYVVSHFQMTETGVGLLEDLSLEYNDLDGRTGENDNLQLFMEAEAEANDVNAQLWLARRYRWGWGGLEHNHRLARRWFERAAAQGNAEGLYNLGVYNLHGYAGFARNEQVALEYFFRASNGSKPFPMAVHAIGNHYSDIGNMSMARKYYQQAAELGSPEGHFSFAMMLREGSGGEQDIPLAVVHLAVASSQNHLRSINFLAHGLYDQESWLAHFGREELMKSRNSSATDYSLKKNSTESTKQSRFRYNVTEPIIVTLPGEKPIRLPNPLGASCEAALPLLKYLSEMGYRSNDLSRAALSSYLNGKLWDAVQFYDELSDMGINFGQDNAVFIYRQLRHQECDGSSIEGRFHIAASVAADSLRNMDHNLKKFGASSIRQPTDEPDTSLHLENYNVTRHLPNLTRTACYYYFDKMIAHRLLQQVNLADPVAFRELATMILNGYTDNDTFSGGKSNEQTGRLSPVPRNVTLAAELFGAAAGQGDVGALMSLGWLLKSGEINVFPANRTAAFSLFSTAFDWEMSASGDKENNLEETTSGLAPTLAKALLWLEILLERNGFLEMWTKWTNTMSESFYIFWLRKVAYISVLFAAQSFAGLYSLCREHNGQLLVVLGASFMILQYVRVARRRRRVIQ